MAYSVLLCSLTSAALYHFTVSTDSAICEWQSSWSAKKSITYLSQQMNTPVTVRNTAMKTLLYGRSRVSVDSTRVQKNPP